MVVERAYYSDPTLRDRIIGVEYFGYPRGAPLVEQNIAYSLEYSQAPGNKSFQHSASVNYSFNRQLEGWYLPPPYQSPFDSTAKDLIEVLKLDELAPVEVSIEHVYNANTRVVTGTITAEFDTQVPTGKYNVGLFVIEQYITGPPPGYLQQSDFIEYTPENPHVEDSNYVFNDILRTEVVNNSIWGGDFINGAVEVGKKYTKTFSYTIPEKYQDLAAKIENIDLVPFVIRIDPDVTQADLDSQKERFPAAVGDPRGEILNVVRQKLTPNHYDEMFQVYIDDMSTGKKYRPGDTAIIVAPDTTIGYADTLFFLEWSGDITGIQDIASSTTTFEVPAYLAFLRTVVEKVTPISTPILIAQTHGVMIVGNSQLKLVNFSAPSAKVKIHSVNGQVLWQKEIQFSNGAAIVPLRLFSKGIYVVSVAGTNLNAIQKFTIK